MIMWYSQIMKFKQLDQFLEAVGADTDVWTEHIQNWKCL